jgi:hypothetical protein
MADEKKLAVFPIMFGRAQAIVGIVKSANGATARSRRPMHLPRRHGGKANASSKSEQVRSLLATSMTAAGDRQEGRVLGPVGLHDEVGHGQGRQARSGRPRSVPTAGMDGLEGIVAAVKNNGTRAGATARRALERIQGIIGEALA